MSWDKGMVTTWTSQQFIAGPDMTKYLDTIDKNGTEEKKKAHLSQFSHTELRHHGKVFKTRNGKKKCRFSANRHSYQITKS